MGLRGFDPRAETFQSYDARDGLAGGGVLIDLVPFGAVEDEQHHVRSPPEFDFEISLLGYHEALELTETVLIDGIEIRVIPLNAFGPLKLLAWADRRHLTPRDAEDFCFVLTSFWEAETERILDAHADLFEAETGDNDFIGARSYGREAAHFVGRLQPFMDTLLDLLERETTDVHDSKLALAMGTACSYACERRFELLRRFRRGLKEALK
jgi:predicted nucleotidyltransferase